MWSWLQLSPPPLRSGPIEFADSPTRIDCPENTEVILTSAPNKLSKAMTFQDVCKSLPLRQRSSELSWCCGRNGWRPQHYQYKSELAIFGRVSHNQRPATINQPTTPKNHTGARNSIAGPHADLLRPWLWW